MNFNAVYLDEILDDSFKLTPNTVIKNGICFGDTIWDFYEENNLRKSSVNKGRFRFDWDIVAKNVGNSIMYDCKVLTYFLIVAPKLFNKKKNAINTIREEVWKTQQIFKEIIAFDQSMLNLDPSFISVADFNLFQFEKVSIHKSQFSVVKRILKYFTNTYIQSHLNKEIQWTSNDIDSLRMRVLPKETFKEIAATPIDSKLYSEIIKRITSDIYVFKKSMCLPFLSKINESIMNQTKKSIVEKVTPEAFKLYLEVLQKDEDEANVRNHRYNGSGILRRKFVLENGYTVKELNKAIRRILGASIITILLFTGMRYSELISLRKKCIITKFDVDIIKGTVIKHRSKNAPVDNDEWVAIPIVKDAIEILELIQLITKNSYLVASLRRVYLSQPDMPYSENGVIELINNYVKNSKEDGLGFESFNLNEDIYKLTSHRFRHSLAQQLVRGRLGIPYLSYHFKHVNTALVAFNKFSDVTLGYGGIGVELRNSAKSFVSAKKELFEQIYSPNAVVVGGQNASDFMKRKKEYYQGLMVNDSEIDDVIEDLKNQSLPFLDVGLGYCAGRKDRVLKDGSREPPPCIGKLRCNPVDCGNAIIPKSKLPVWKKVYEDAKSKLNDGSFDYMSVELKETIKRAEMVINHFRNLGGD